MLPPIPAAETGQKPSNTAMEEGPQESHAVEFVLWWRGWYFMNEAENHPDSM